jgi:arylsulfatase A-like enzyme
VTDLPGVSMPEKSTRADAQRPNIVLCVMDDHQHDALSVAGHPVVETPFLDQLAQEGCRFSQALMPGGTSPAVCMPSRAMIHTGRSLFHIEGCGGVIPPAHPTLGEMLRKQGYCTFHTGKWHQDEASFNRSFDSGQAIFFGGMSDPWNVGLYDYDPSGEYGNHLPRIPDPMRSNTIVPVRGDYIEAGRHCTDIFCDHAAQFIRDTETTKPFFLSVALMAPHDPRTAPPAYHERYQAKEIELPEAFMTSCPVDTGALAIRDECLAAQPRDPAEIKQHLAAYYAMISHLDDGLRRIMDAVVARGLTENTWFVFTSDHGLALGRHGLMGKQNLFEHSIRVPLIVRAPGVKPGQIRTDPVWHYDLYATLLNAAGATSPSDTDARDLFTDRQGKDALDDKPLYFAYCSTIRGLRQGPYKWIEYAHKDYRSTQLFDLANDPQELHDLAQAPEHAARASAMSRLLREVASSSGDHQHPLGQAFWALAGG